MHKILAFGAAAAALLAAQSAAGAAECVNGYMTLGNGVVTMCDRGPMTFGAAAEFEPGSPEVAVGVGFGEPVYRDDRFYQPAPVYRRGPSFGGLFWDDNEVPGRVPYDPYFAAAPIYPGDVVYDDANEVPGRVPYDPYFEATAPVYTGSVGFEEENEIPGRVPDEPFVTATVPVATGPAIVEDGNEIPGRIPNDSFGMAASFAECQPGYYYMSGNVMLACRR